MAPRALLLSVTSRGFGELSRSVHARGATAPINR
jgi:hypothetical protein